MNINVHHTSYENIGDELFQDLLVVCRECHETLEKRITRMIGRGFTRRRVLARYQPVMIRRLLKIHETEKEIRRK